MQRNQRSRTYQLTSSPLYLSRASRAPSRQTDAFLAFNPDDRWFNCGRTLSCISPASEIVPLQSRPYLPLALSKLKHLGHSLIESICQAGSALHSGRAVKSIICDKRHVGDGNVGRWRGNTKEPFYAVVTQNQS